MERTQLGKTDLLVSRICFGCWQLSPKFWGEISIDSWREAVITAIESGVNFIDTADAYGEGYSERELGKVLSESKLRKEVVLATKFYWHFEEDPRYPNTSYDHIIKACENSLHRLRTDHIDLYQIHSWDPLTLPDEVASALIRLKKEGKIRWIGVSNLNPEQMRMYERHFEINCLQPNYSLLEREVESMELPYCQANRIGVIPYSPLYRGLLTGKYDPNYKFNDSRANNPLFCGKSFAHMLKEIQSLKPIAEKYELSIAQLSIRWILTHPAITSAIVGIKDSDQIRSILPAAGGLLEKSDWHNIGSIIAKAKKEALSFAK